MAVKHEESPPLAAWSHEGDESPARAVLRSGRLLDTLEPYERIVVGSHVNPDPDALASMLGIGSLIEQGLPGKSVALVLDGFVARAENQAMVRLLEIPLVARVDVKLDGAATVLVDTQPSGEIEGRGAAAPLAVIDHHETPGQLEGVAFRDIRPTVGATSTIVAGYLLEQEFVIDRRLATALLYGIESETQGYPREASAADDGALIWLFPRADKDLLARIRSPRLPQSYFATYQHALSNAFLYGDVIVSYCGRVPQPDIVAELADFFIRFDQVAWAMTLGLFEQRLKISVRADHIGGHSGDVLRRVVAGLGSAGGHDKRAGGSIELVESSPESMDLLLRKLRRRFLSELDIDEQRGRRLLSVSPMFPVP